jgi:uncharacterized protein
MRNAVATYAGSRTVDAQRAGVGLRLPHLAEVATAVPPASFLEIHPENFLANPHARELLAVIGTRYRLSVHTVGLSIGSADGVDLEHLARVRRLVDEIDPVLVSGHLAWSMYRGVYLNDLLPLPYDDETLRIVAAHVEQIQQALGRPYLVENPACYVGFAGSRMGEAEFLTELVHRTGCKLLCDVGNVFVSATNMGYDAYAYIDALPAHAVGEIHLGGFTPEPDDGAPGREVLIDTHAAAIAEPVWELYAYALGRFGPRPTLIEWDNDIPPFATLMAEAERANSVAARVLGEGRQHAAAR